MLTKDLLVGMHVRVHPASDLFMRGVTRAKVTGIRKHTVTIVSTCAVATGKIFVVLAHNLMPDND